VNLLEWAIEVLICPVCGGKLNFQAEITCLNKKCGAKFPVLNKIPILINSKNSIFSIEDFVNRRDMYFKHSRQSFIDVVLKLAPKISANVMARKN